MGRPQANEPRDIVSRERRRAARERKGHYVVHRYRESRHCWDQSPTFPELIPGASGYEILEERFYPGIAFQLVNQSDAFGMVGGDGTSRSRNGSCGARRTKRPLVATSAKEDTMKKRALEILTLDLSLFAALALIGCGGGNKDMRTDYGWLKLQVPEDAVLNPVAGDTANKVQFKFNNENADRIYFSFEEGMTVEEHVEYQGKWHDLFDWTVEGPVTFGDKTYTAACFTHTGGTTYEYFTEVDGGSVYISIDNVEDHVEGVETVLSTLEFAEDVPNAIREAREVKLDDIEIVR